MRACWRGCEWVDVEDPDFSQIAAEFRVQPEPGAPTVMSTALYLYVWPEFSPGYCGNGLAFAIALNEEEAKEGVQRTVGNPVHWGPIKVLPTNQAVAFAIEGED